MKCSSLVMLLGLAVVSGCASGGVRSAIHDVGVLGTALGAEEVLGQSEVEWGGAVLAGFGGVEVEWGGWESVASASGVRLLGVPVSSSAGMSAPSPVRTATRQPSTGQLLTRQPSTRQPSTRQPSTRQPSTRQTSSALLTADRWDPTSLAAALLRESNTTRRAHGAGGLLEDAALTRAAVAYARELARRGEIEHLSPTPGRRTFRERIAAEGAYPRLGGENLARLTSSPSSLGGRVVDAWLRSPGHRVNLLDPIFARTGVGVWLGGDGVWYVVQLYATSS